MKELINHIGNKSYVHSTFGEYTKLKDTNEWKKLVLLIKSQKNKVFTSR